MMSYKQWLVLLLIYLIFLLVGSIAFMYLEVWNELEDREALQDLKRRVINVVSNLENDSRSDVEEVVQEMSDNCKHDFLHLVEDEPLTWSLWNSFFFTFTVVTTIGFGHMSPSTQWGKIFCIIYATIGVPLNGILIASLADIFSSKIVNSRVRSRAKRYESWFGVAADAILYLLPGFIIFLILPAAILVAAEEGWDYLDSFYYAFITLTTIGFGDLVAGLQETNYILVWLYKIISFIWILFGLGYLIMTISFIQKALKSNKVHDVERRLAKALKKHVNKMNSNVHHDLNRFRKVVNTLSEIRAENGSGDDLKSAMYQASLQPDTKADSRNQDRVFRSLHSTPKEKRNKMKREKRSASEVALNNAEKIGALPQDSVENVNIFLDMVEILLKEHQAEAAKRVGDEAHNIMKDTQTDSNLDSNSDEETSNNPNSANLKPKDLESGYVNKGYIDDDDKVNYELENDKAKKNDNTEDDISGRLQRKLSVFLGVPELENSSDSSVPKSPIKKAKTASELLGLMESLVCQPPSNTEGQSTKVKYSRQFSSSVPGHYRSTPENGRPHLLDLFQQVTPDSDCSSTKDKNIVTDSVVHRRRWSVCDSNAQENQQPHPEQSDRETLEESEHSKTTSVKLIPKWVRCDSEQENKDDTDDTPDHTRL